MTEGLPEGLVVTTGKVRSGFESLSGVEVEDIAQLWRGITAVLCAEKENIIRLTASLLCSLHNKQLFSPGSGRTPPGKLLLENLGQQAHIRRPLRPNSGYAVRPDI